MRVLVTGGSGLVGKNILRKIKGRSAYSEVYAPPSTELDLLDSRKVKTILLKFNPDVIIHAAGLVGGISRHAGNQTEFYIKNLTMGLNLVGSSLECGIKRLINISSGSIYPDDLNDAISEDQLFNGHPNVLSEGYSLAKISVLKYCEFITTEYEDYCYKTVVPCNIFGVGDHFDERAHMLPALISRLHLANINGLDNVDIWGDGTARREFLFAEDFANSIDFCLSNITQLPSFVNVGYGYDYSVTEYNRIVADVVGYSGGFSYDRSKPVGNKRKLLDSSKIKELGWKPEYSLKEAIKLTYDSFLSEQ